MSETGEQEQAEETREARLAREAAEFEAIPAERTFAVLKLYLNEEGCPVGVMQYNGHRLRALDVSNLTGVQCRAITLLVHKYTQQVVFEVGNAFQSIELLRSMMGGNNDGEDSGEGTGGEGSGGGEGLAQPGGSVPRDQ